MGLFDALYQGYNMGQDMRYSGKERESKYQTSLAELLTKQAQANAAPKYYNGQADLMGNEATYAGIKNQYAPQDFQSQIALRQEQANNLRNQRVGGPNFSTNVGKAFQDRKVLAGLYGEDSPEIQAMDAYIAKESGSNSNSNGVKIMFDKATGQYTAVPTRANQTKNLNAMAGAQNVSQYLDTVMDKLPQFQTLGSKIKVGAEKAANLLGANFQGPSDLAEGEAAITQSAEGFLNTFGLNSTNENMRKVEKIFTPQLGESGKGFRARAHRQLNDLLAVELRAKQRAIGEIPLGITPDQRNAQFQNAVAPPANAVVPPKFNNPVSPQANAPEMALTPQQVTKLQRLQQQAQIAIQQGANKELIEQRLQQKTQEIMGAQ